MVNEIMMCNIAIYLFSACFFVEFRHTTFFRLSSSLMLLFHFAAAKHQPIFSYRSTHGMNKNGNDSGGTVFFLRFFAFQSSSNAVTWMQYAAQGIRVVRDPIQNG